METLINTLIFKPNYVFYSDDEFRRKLEQFRRLTEEKTSLTLARNGQNRTSQNTQNSSINSTKIIAGHTVQATIEPPSKLLNHKKKF